MLKCLTVGNKNDCPDRKVVLYEDAKRFADHMDIMLFETSAKSNNNVDEVSEHFIISSSYRILIFICTQSIIQFHSLICRCF